MAEKYFEIDSTYRNRNNYSNPYDFTVPYSSSNKGSTSLTFIDPILDSSPYTGSNTKIPGELTTNISIDTINIALDSQDVAIDNFYINNNLQLGNEYRKILSYNGTTKIATVDTSFSIIPPFGTIYYIRKLTSYFSSNVAIANYNSLTNTVNQLNLLATNPSLVPNFYTGSYIRFSNGPHANSTALITDYNPNGSVVIFSQENSLGANNYISTVVEQGFMFSPNVTGIIDSIVLNISALETVGLFRTFTLKIREGIGFGGTILYNNNFNVNNTSNPTDLTFNISANFNIYSPGYYTISLIDITPNGIDTGFINLWGISSDNYYQTFNTEVYPKTTIKVLPFGDINVSQPNTSDLFLNIQIGLIAVSIRKLYSTYNGNCLQIRRDNDNTTLDIGFIDNIIDIETVLTFVGSNNGYVTIWYDQSGNNNNLIQPSNVLQPIITVVGALSNKNNMPSITFSTTHLYNTTNITVRSINIICSINPNPLFSYIVGAINIDYGVRTVNNQFPNANANDQMFGGSFYINNVLNNSTAIPVNTNVLTSLSTISIAPFAFSNGLSVGNYNTVLGRPFGGYISEAIIFFNALTTNDLNVLYENQKNFYKIV